MIERRTVRMVEFKQADDEGPGEFEGLGAVFGNVDDGGDVIVKGAFKDALPDFLERGFVPVSHNWFDLPVATVSDAKELDEGLWFKAEFHSTQAAQEARTVMSERMERGKFVGLSIGYLLDWRDEESAEFTEDGVRVIKKIEELAEISIVTVPMNREAGVSAVKMGLDPASFSEHTARILADVDALTVHAQRHVDMRRKEGRVLSSANRERLATIQAGLTEAAKSLGAILAETDPDKPEKARRLLQLRHDQLMHDAVLLGAVDKEYGR